MSDKAPAFLWIGIALISAVLAGFFVVLRGLPIPIGDQWWDPVHVAVLTRQGQLSAHDLFAYSEGHRLVNIRIITWLMTILTDYNPILMNSATWVFSAINVLLAYRLLCNQRIFSHRLPRNYRLAGLALFSATLFCITHGQAWIDFYFSQWQLSFLFVLLAGAIVQAWPGSWQSFLALLSMAALASFSCGLGLGSWVAIPIMASSRKSFRTLSALLAWLLACGLFIAFYFSDYARVPGKTVVETSSLSNPKSWVLALGFSLSRRFISDTSDPVFPKIILIFSLASLLLFLALSLFLWKRGLEKIVLLWAGVASFSMMGSLMIFLSRGSIVPAERHSPGSDGYWLSFIALGIHYLYVNHLSEWRQKGVSHQWLGLGSILFLISLWVLGIGRTLTSFKQNGDWRNPTYFSRSCIDATRSHPVLRDLAFRNCFMFGDERSTYQFALMRLGNMKTDHIKRPIYDDSKVKVFALLPSRLMAAFTDQYLFKVGPQAGQSLLGKRVYYSPAKEQPLMKLWPTPMTWHMDWNDLGGGKRTPTTIHTLNGVRDEVNKLDPQSDSVLLIAAKEMEPEVKAVVSLLSKAGFVELPNRSLAQSNRQFPSLRAICFAGRRPDQSIGQVHPCNGPALVEIPAPTANSNPI